MKKYLSTLMMFLMLTLSTGAWADSDEVTTKSQRGIFTKFLEVGTVGTFTSWFYNALNVRADFTVPEPTDGGDLGVMNTITGAVNCGLAALGTMTNGTTNTVSEMDDTPAAEWLTTDANDVTSTEIATSAKKGTKSLQVVFASTADATDGVNNTLGGGDQNWTDDESVGFWIKSSIPLAAGDLVFKITDATASSNLNVPAVLAGKWTWVEVAVGGVTNANKDAVTDIGVLLSTAGATKVAALGGATVLLDYMWKWDAADEEALSQNLVFDGGVRAVLAVATAAGSANTLTALVEGTDYFVHYEATVDFLVTITDQSAASGMAMVCYQ